MHILNLIAMGVGYASITLTLSVVIAFGVCWIAGVRPRRAPGDFRTLPSDPTSVIAPDDISSSKGRTYHGQIFQEIFGPPVKDRPRLKVLSGGRSRHDGLRSIR